MTSEIAVMNQRAVALAADSAVTLIDGRTVVVRNEQRKLYQLLEGEPVGVMFYGVADVMGHPWDQLIAHFQKNHAGARTNLAGYATAFTGMLDHLEEFFPRERHKDEYRRLLASVYGYILRYAAYLQQTSGDRDGADIAILDAAIEQVWRDYQYLEDGAPRADLPCFPPGFGEVVLRDHTDQIEELISYGFAAAGLGQQAQRRLRDIAVYCVTKDLFLEDVTGLVFGGFGSEDRYPVLSTWFVSAIVSGIAKRAEASVDAIDTDIKSKIRIFADSEVTNAFIRGIDFNLERRLYGGFAQMMVWPCQRGGRCVRRCLCRQARRGAPQLSRRRAGLSGNVPRHDGQLSAAGLYQSGVAGARNRAARRSCRDRARTGWPQRLQEAYHGAARNRRRRH